MVLWGLSRTMFLWGLLEVVKEFGARMWVPYKHRLKNRYLVALETSFLVTIHLLV